MKRAAKPTHHPWRNRGWVAAIFVLGVTTTLGAVWLAHQRRLAFFAEELANAGRDVASDLATEANAAGSAVEALAAFVENFPDINQDSFAAFVARTAAKWPGFHAALWQPAVTRERRAAFEATMRATGFAGFRILEQRVDGALVPAGDRSLHLPVLLFSAPDGANAPVGLDLAPDPIVMASKWQALEQGTPATSSFLVIPGRAGERDETNVGFTISAAVVAPGSGALRDRLRGFVSATFLVAPMVRAATAGRDVAALRISLLEGLANTPRGVAWQSPASTSPATPELAPRVERIAVPLRSWMVEFTATTDFLRGPMAQFPAYVVAAGLTGTIGLTLLLAHRARERRQRRLVEQERHDAEFKFHDVVENMAGAVTVFAAVDQGARFVIRVLNASAAAWATADGGELVGGPLEEVFGRELHGQLHEAMRRVWVSGQAEKLPPLSRVSAGVLRWFACNLFRLTSGEVVAVCNDLTFQKEIEAELRQARAELELALDSSRVGLWSWERPVGRVRLDARAGDILDVGASESVAHSDLTERIHAEDLPRLEAQATASMAQRREFEMEIRCARRDGSWRRLCLRARPVNGADGEVRQIVGCVWDVTDRRQAEEHEQRVLRLESVATLAGGVAHDLNNALVPITVGLDLLRLRLGDDTESAETLLSMTESTRNATAIVRQLAGLTLGRIGREAAAQPRLILDGLREQWRALLPRAITLTIEPAPGELPTVRADAAQVQQVLLNLATNAREAMRDGGRLTVRCEVVVVGPSQRTEFPELAAGRFVAFSVHDTGPGIPECIRDRIFDPFFTTKDTGRGAGMGLATVQAIVRARRGAIRFETGRDRGTTFTVYLPAAGEKVMQPVTVPKTESRPAASLRGRCVLLVDDESIVREVAVRVLEKAGVRVLVGRDGREAVDLFSRHSSEIDAVILDLLMPGIDGATACAAIRGIRADIPVLGASGYAAESVLEQASAAGFTAFLRKPYTMDGLIEALRGVLRPLMAATNS